MTAFLCTKKKSVMLSVHHWRNEKNRNDVLSTYLCRNKQGKLQNPHWRLVL